MLNLLRTVLIVLSLATVATAQDDFHTTMMRATIKLKHEKSTATGFVVRKSMPNDKDKSRSILITAAHVLESTTGDETTLVYRVREAEGVYKKESIPLPIRKDDKPLWTRHPKEDVAVMVITPPEKADLSMVSADLLANDELLRKHQVHPGEAVAYLGYPHRVEANEAGFPILRMGAIASYPLVPSSVNKEILLSGNTFEGDSGGPIYLAEPACGEVAEKPAAGLILGLMHGQHFLDEEMVMIYGTSKLRHRLGLGIVVPAAFIRETLELLP